MEKGIGATGSCHCGAVRFRVVLPEEPEAYRCNCSLCRRKGAAITPVPISALTLLTGWEAMSVYQFNTRVAKHYFCKTCGVYTFHQRRIDPESYGINIGCLDDLPPETFGPIVEADGANE